MTAQRIQSKEAAMCKKAIAGLTLTLITVLLIPAAAFAKSNSATFAITLRIPERPGVCSEQASGITTAMTRNGESVLITTIVEE